MVHVHYKGMTPFISNFLTSNPTHPQPSNQRQRPRRERDLKRFLVAATFFTFLYAAFAQELPARVAVFSLLTNDERGAAVCETVDDSIGLTLRLLAKYELVDPPALNSLTEYAAITEYAESHSIDYYIYGRFQSDETGEIGLNLFLYDRAIRDELSFDDTAVSIFEAIDLADRLIIELLEFLSGAHIGYGRLTLENLGEPGKYDIKIDGTYIGTDLVSIDKVLYGARRVEVLQRRMLGTEIILSDSIEIIENESRHVSFSVPLLLDHESEYIRSTTAKIRSSFKNSDMREYVDYLIADTYDSIFETTEYSPRIADLRPDFDQISAEYEIQKDRFLMESYPTKPSLDFIDRTAAIFRRKGNYPDPDRLGKLAIENARILGTLFVLAASAEMDAGNQPEASKQYRYVEALGILFDSDDRFGNSADLEWIRGIDPSDARRIKQLAEERFGSRHDAAAKLYDEIAGALNKQLIILAANDDLSIQPNEEFTVAIPAALNLDSNGDFHFLVSDDRGNTEVIAGTVVDSRDIVFVDWEPKPAIDEGDDGDGAREAAIARTRWFYLDVQSGGGSVATAGFNVLFLRNRFLFSTLIGVNYEDTANFCWVGKIYVLLGAGEKVTSYFGVQSTNFLRSSIILQLLGPEPDSHMPIVSDIGLAVGFQIALSGSQSSIYLENVVRLVRVPSGDGPYLRYRPAFGVKM